MIGLARKIMIMIKSIIAWLDGIEVRITIRSLVFNTAQLLALELHQCFETIYW